MLIKQLISIIPVLLLCITNVATASNYKPSIIIVGAGPSGIAAASRLLENDINNISILEAEGRIGGRIHSVKFGDAMVDLGAQWCHGEENNTVYELVKNLDLLEPGNLTLHVYHSSKKDVDQAFIQELMILYDDMYKGEKQCDEISLGQYMTERYNKTISEYYGDDEEKTELANESMDTIMKWIISTEGCFTWFAPSAKSDYKECDGNPILNWKGRGYRTILDVLMKKYPNSNNELPVTDKIMFNKEVTEVVWNSKENPQGVVVRCSDDSEYIADHVILTVSLGVLKDRYKTLFQPALPIDKINAIESLGIEAVIKIFFHFPERFWPADFNDFTFLWNERDIETSAQEFPEGPNENGKSWITNIAGFYIAENNPNVLSAWICGEFVPLIETIPEDTIINGAMFALKKFVGYKFDNITRPDSIMRHNWYSNPHFRGTYSFQTVQARKKGTSQEIVLAQPLTSNNGKLTLLFAGEATHPYYYSTVHGAIETGFREADRLIELYK